MPPAQKRKRPTLPSTKPSRAHRSQQPAQKKSQDVDDDDNKYSKRPKFDKRSDWKAKKAERAAPASTKPIIHDPRKKNRGAKRSKVEEESEDSGYEEVGFQSDRSSGEDQALDSSDDEVDITAALSGAMPSASAKGKARSALPSQESRFSGRKSSSALKGTEPEVGDGSDGDDDFIAEMMGKKNMEDGKAVVKDAVGKKGDNGRGVKEASGGGSFQSMGTFPSFFPWF